MNGTLNIRNYQSSQTRVPVCQFTCNASWVWIRDKETSNILFQREPNNETWYDAKHRAIVDAMETLEKAIIAAVNG